MIFSKIEPLLLGIEPLLLFSRWQFVKKSSEMDATERDMNPQKISASNSQWSRRNLDFSSRVFFSWNKTTGRAGNDFDLLKKVNPRYNQYINPRVANHSLWEVRVAIEIEIVTLKWSVLHRCWTYCNPEKEFLVLVHFSFGLCSKTWFAKFDSAKNTLYGTRFQNTAIRFQTITFDTLAYSSSMPRCFENSTLNLENQVVGSHTIYFQWNQH